MPRAQQSTTQSPLNKAANQVRADQSTYEKKYVLVLACTYVHACGVRVVFLEHEALGICKSPVCTQNVGPSTTNTVNLSCVALFLVSERSGQNRPLRVRSAL